MEVIKFGTYNNIIMNIEIWMFIALVTNRFAYEEKTNVTKYIINWFNTNYVLAVE